MCILSNYAVYCTDERKGRIQRCTQETSFGELCATAAVVNQLKITNTLNICFRIQCDNCYFIFFHPANTRTDQEMGVN